MTEILDAALAYALAGLRVLPVHVARAGVCSCKRGAECEDPGKHPCITDWRNRASVDPAEIASWWSRWPHASVGILTGAPSGIVALDVDTQVGGKRTLAERERAFGKLPRTARTLTGGGGEHVLFRHPGYPVGNSAGKLGPALDIRGDGGFIVAPPSVHASGRPYRWLQPFDADALADLPPWILNGDGQVRSQGRPAAVPLTIPEGQRNATLASLAGTMRRRGTSAEAIRAALQVENRDRCHPPLAAAEVDAIAESIGRYPPKEPAVVAIRNERKGAFDHLAAAHGLDDFVPVDAAEGEEPAAAASLCVVVSSDFANAEESSADPLIGEHGETPLTVDSDVLIYGEAGSGKTTLEIDLAVHLAAGQAWLGLTIPHSRCVLLVEAEGPRGPYREKLKRKIDTWAGQPFADNLFVLEEPWPAFTLAEESHRAALATAILDNKIDVVCLGPLAAIGAEGGGTPEQVTNFAVLTRDLRARVGRPLAIVYIHHENKAGDVSGAWERLPDTLAHLRLEGHERSILHWRKVRWSSELHNSKMTLRWLTDKEGFELVDAGDATAVKRAAELGDATAWILAHVTEHPGLARSKIEGAFHEHHGKGRRSLAREAINNELEALKELEIGSEQTARTPLLATTIGERANGTYLIPFTQATSPLAKPLFGEDSDEGSDPVPGMLLATSPPARRAGEGNGEEENGVATDVEEDGAKRLYLLKNAYDAHHITHDEYRGERLRELRLRRIELTIEAGQAQ